MNKNKLVIKVIFCFVIVLSVFNINLKADNELNNEANGMLDSFASESTYKFSDNEGKVYLPYVRFAKDRIIMDKEIDKMGAVFSGQSIEVESNLKDIQVLFAGDAVRINRNMEYAIVFSGSNTTISSKIEKNAIIFSGEKVTISEDAIIKGDIICFAPEIEVNGKIEGSLIGSAEKLVVNGNIKNDLRFESNDVNLGDEVVLGKIYINTTNKELSIPESYKEAIINVSEYDEKEYKFNFSVIIMGLVTGLVFTLVYFIVSKVGKKEFMENSLNKIKSNSTFLVLSGILNLMLIPAVLLVLFILACVGLYMIAIPSMILYFSFLLVAGLLSTFIVGTAMTEYMSRTKYLEGKGKNVNYLFAFLTYTLLYILARVPVIGGYVTTIIVILSIGILLSIIFKKEKINIKENKSEEKA